MACCRDFANEELFNCFLAYHFNSRTYFFSTHHEDNFFSLFSYHSFSMQSPEVGKGFLEASILGKGFYMLFSNGS